MVDGGGAVATAAPTTVIANMLRRARSHNNAVLSTSFDARPKIYKNTGTNYYYTPTPHQTGPGAPTLGGSGTANTPGRPSLAQVISHCVPLQQNCSPPARRPLCQAY